MQHVYSIKIKTTTDLYRFIRLRFDKITDLRNMQIFDKVYQTGVCLVVCVVVHISAIQIC